MAYKQVQEPEIQRVYSFNVIHIPCNRLIIQYLIQPIAHVTMNNHSLFCDAPLPCFGPCRLSSGKSFTKEYIIINAAQDVHI